MQVTKTVEETRKQIKAWKKEGKTVGLVPTMGFLHEGHASLIKKCREQDRKSTRLNSSHNRESRMPSSA